MLEAGDEIEGLRVAGGEGLVDGGACRRVGAGEEGFAAGFGFWPQIVQLDVAQDGGFDSREGKEEVGVEACDGCGAGGFGSRGFAGEMELGLDLGERERDGAGIAVQGKGVDPGTAGIAEAEELGDFVEGFSGGVVEGAADEGVLPCAGGGAGEVEVGVAAGHYEGQGWVVAKGLAIPGLRSETWGTRRARSNRRSFDSLRSLRMTIRIGRALGVIAVQLGLALVEEDGVDVAFQMVDGDEGQIGGEGQGFGVGDADEQGAGEAWTGGYGDGVEVGEGDAGLGERGADDRDDGAEMLAGGQFGDDSAISGVGGDLRGDNRAERVGPALDDGGGGLVARGFDGQD